MRTRFPAPAIAAALLALTALPAWSAGTTPTQDLCYWQTAHWNELTANQRDLLGRLGWTQTNWESDNPEDHPPSEHLTWAELTDAEREINEALGQTESSWDNPPDCP